MIIGLYSCCDTFCERRKYAENIIIKVEEFRKETGQIPDNIAEIGLVESEDSKAYYLKISDSTYSVWYAIGFESKVYDSQTKEWKEG